MNFIVSLFVSNIFSFLYKCGVEGNKSKYIIMVVLNVLPVHINEMKITLRLGRPIRGSCHGHRPIVSDLALNQDLGQFQERMSKRFETFTADLKIFSLYFNA